VNDVAAPIVQHEAVEPCERPPLSVAAVFRTEGILVFLPPRVDTQGFARLYFRVTAATPVRFCLIQRYTPVAKKGVMEFHRREPYRFVADVFHVNPFGDQLPRLGCAGTGFVLPNGVGLRSRDLYM
jgi:hypothetical protein